jgi:hypothetical protein
MFILIVKKIWWTEGEVTSDGKEVDVSASLYGVPNR